MRTGNGGADDGGWSSGKERAPTAAENEDAIAFGRKFGLGCFTFIVGFFSGGMVAVLIGRIVAFFTKAPSCEGLPICNWLLYVGVGGVLGAVSLPTLVLRRLTQKERK
ncbi:MAG: hypothetical protein IT359_11235 [Gemmatimonadaceae bacterium]|nr:hypothetical protein [Gemmatimonadaceae bacterium]